jgi:acetate---CoA ligase (ADP-forming)
MKEADGPKRLDRLFNPGSVAIVGATHGPHPSYNAVENLRLLGFNGEIGLVNPKYQELHGLPCYPSVSDLPTVPDAVLIMTPARYVPAIVEECAQLGVTAATVYSAGFGESGPDGAALEAEFVATAERNGMAITGGNGLGWLNINAGVGLYAGSLPREFGPGNVAVISQSGSGLIAVVHSGRQLPLGFVLSSGNEAVVDTADTVDWLADQAEIDVILLFLETVRRGPAFVAAVERARAAGKVLIALKTGRSEVGRKAALAHTGALAGSDLAYDAVFRRLGIHRARTLDELIEMGVLFATRPPTPSATGLGLLTVSGGLMALYADLAEPLGLDFPALSDETAAAFREVLDRRLEPSNPLDATGAVYSPEIYTRYVEIMASDPRIGAVAIAQDAPPGMGPTQTARYRRVLGAVCQAAERAATPIFLFTSSHGGIEASLWEELRRQPFPVLFGAAEALRTIAAYLEPKRELTGAATRKRGDAATDQARARFILRQADGPLLTERASKALVRLYGIATSEPLPATSAEEAATVAERLAFPLVAKVESPDLTHKARVGGVRLGLRSTAEVAEAYEQIVSAVRRHRPDARVGGIILEREAPPGLEILAGLWRDPTFGPLILLGLGGAYAEAVSGQAAASVPLSRRDAEQLVAGSAVGRALEKSGHTPDALSRLVELLVRLSELADDLRDEVEELDLNPIRFTAPDGEPAALDALVVLRGGVTGSALALG